MTSLAVHPNIMERLADEITVLQEEINVNHGKKGNAERRERLAKLFEKYAFMTNRLSIMRRNSLIQHVAGRRHHDILIRAEERGAQAVAQYHAQKRANCSYQKRLIDSYIGGHFIRDQYGSINFERAANSGYSNYDANRACKWFKTHPGLRFLQPFTAAWDTVRRAEENKIVPAEYNNLEWRERWGAYEGSKRTYEMYAFSRDGDLALIQVRTFERTSRRHGTSVTLQYFLTDGENAVEIKNGAKNLIKRAAKTGETFSADAPLRAIYKHLSEEWRHRVEGGVDTLEFSFAAPKIDVSIGYKLVGRRSEDGALISLFDGSTVWAVGTKRIEKVQKKHGGGLYFYLTAEEAKSLKGVQWPKAEHQIDGYVLLEVKPGGRILRYGKKYAASQLTPLSIVEVM